MVGVEYSYAHEVGEIADEIIRDHHPHLADKTVVYVFRTPAAAKHGRVVLGKARKISGLNAFLSTHGQFGPFFLMEIAADNWKTLTEAQRRALVDHELSHMTVDDEERPVLTGHDVEEFTGVVERHGLWKEDVQAFALAVQLALPMDGGEQG